MSVQRYRKKPVVIEAMQYDGRNTVEVAEWLRASDVKVGWSNAAMIIPTLEGRMEASPGDWIIRGVQGEFYPCREDIFRQTYEASEQADREPSEDYPDAEALAYLRDQVDAYDRDRDTYNEEALRDAAAAVLRGCPAAPEVNAKVPASVAAAAEENALVEIVAEWLANYMPTSYVPFSDRIGLARTILAAGFRKAGREPSDAAVEAAADAIVEASFGQELPEAPIDLARAALLAAQEVRRG